MSVIDMRPAAATRTPRSFIEDAVSLGAFLEGPEPPLALGQCEVTLIVGRPPDPSGSGGSLPFSGVRVYVHEQALIYRRDDGQILTYKYEGDLAYALDSITTASNQTEAPE